LALSTITSAIQAIHPWNFSFKTLEYFLTKVAFGEKKLARKPNRISFMSDFID